MALERAIHNDDRPEVVHRSTAIRQLHLGFKTNVVAQACAVSDSTIRRWWNLWQEGGIDALANRPRSGRPPKTDEAYWLELDEVIESHPHEHGYNFVVWTLDRLREHMEIATGIGLSKEWLRVKMEKRGYVYRRPKGDLRALQDPEARAEAEAMLEQYKKAQAGDFELLFVDESTVTLELDIRACWMKRGKQTRLPAPPGARKFHHVIGALNWRTQKVSHTIVQRKNGQTFIEFLEHVFETEYPNKPLMVVMDNAPYHRSKEVKAMLNLYTPRVVQYWLPPYCATLNPIERFWRHMKDIGKANTLYPSDMELLKNIEGAIRNQNKPDHELRINFAHD